MTEKGCVIAGHLGHCGTMRDSLRCEVDTMFFQYFPYTVRNTAGDIHTGEQVLMERSRRKLCDKCYLLIE